MRRSLAVICLLACGKHPRGEIDRDKAKDVFSETVIDTPPGISGLAAGEHGELWMIPERDHFLVSYDAGKVQTFPLTGVPDGVDTEDIPYLGDDTLALGMAGQ